jgi:outer membrane protein TolC
VTLDSSRGFEGQTTQARSQASFAASAAVPVLTATGWAGISQARDQVAVANLTSTDLRRQIAVSAAQAYLAVLAAQRQIDVGTRALETARAHLDYAQKRLSGGVGSRLNELRAAQEVARDEASLENTRLALRRSQEALGVLMGENAPVDAGAEPALEAPAGADEDAWLRTRTDLQRDTAIIQAAERVVRDAWKIWLPSASFAFEPQIVAPASLFQPSRSYRLVFSVSQRVFDRTPRVIKALDTVALNRALLARSETEIAARSELRLAREAVESYDRALASARLAATQAAEVLRITTTAFEVGATTNLEVIDAQRQARDFEAAATVAEDAARRARLDLLVAAGQFPR